MPSLGPDSAHIFRITHVKNVPWILDHGIHCTKGNTQDPHFIPIGKQEVIDKRRDHPVEIEPFGTLGDYVPFYFTPWSIMMYYIKTGYGGVTKRPNPEIAILVSSVPRLVELGITFFFTNAAAYFQEAEPFNRVEDLPRIDWPLLRSRNFKADPEDPGKQGRYHAEALVHKHLPLNALLGIACYDAGSRAELETEAKRRNRSLTVKTIPGWYF